MKKVATPARTGQACGQRFTATPGDALSEGGIEDEIGEFELADLMDARAFQSLMEHFYELTGMPVSIVDGKGRLLAGAGQQELCRGFHREQRVACSECLESDTVVSADVLPGGFRLHRSVSSMWSVATPLMVCGRQMGSILSGPFFFEGETPDCCRIRLEAGQCGFDEAEYLAALRAVPRFSRKTVNTAMTFFVKLTGMLLEQGYGGVKLAGSLAERDALMDSLQESREDLNRAQAVARTGSWRLDVRQNKLLWSDETYRIFGIPKQTDMTYEIFLAAVHPDDRELVDRKWAAALRGEIYDVEHRITAEGRIKWVREKAGLEFDEQGALLGGFGTVQDITDRKRAEDSLQRSYTLTRTIIDSMNDAISLLDVRDFTIVGVNSVFLKSYGYSDESEVLGKHCYAVTHHRPDICSPPDDVCPLLETVRTGEHFSVDHVHYDRQGERIYVEVSTSPIRDEAGNVVQVVHVQRNITERKRAEEERERLLADLTRSNRELEQFAYVASHDLQEPLRMVASYVQLLDRKYHGKLDQKADSYIHFAREGALRMQDLIDGLLAYSRISRRGTGFRPVDLNRVVSLAVSNLSAAIRETRAVITKEDLPSIAGDETQLVQLFQNLISNGVKYRKRDTPPRVRLWAKRDGGNHVFAVTDNGIGIAPEYFERIFQLFQRLHAHSEYRGTGIGLALSKRIVERHHGRIWVESVPGEGSTFFFTVPFDPGGGT